MKKILSIFLAFILLITSCVNATSAKRPTTIIGGRITSSREDNPNEFFDCKIPSGINEKSFYSKDGTAWWSNQGIISLDGYKFRPGEEVKVSLYQPNMCIKGNPFNWKDFLSYGPDVDCNRFTIDPSIVVEQEWLKTLGLDSVPKALLIFLAGKYGQNVWDKFDNFSNKVQNTLGSGSSANQNIFESGWSKIKEIPTSISDKYREIKKLQKISGKGIFSTLFDYFFGINTNAQIFAKQLPTTLLKPNEQEIALTTTLDKINAVVSSNRKVISEGMPTRVLSGISDWWKEYMTGFESTPVDVRREKLTPLLKLIKRAKTEVRDSLSVLGESNAELACDLRQTENDLSILEDVVKKGVYEKNAVVSNRILRKGVSNGFKECSEERTSTSVNTTVGDNKVKSEDAPSSVSSSNNPVFKAVAITGLLLFLYNVLKYPVKNLYNTLFGKDVAEDEKSKVEYEYGIVLTTVEIEKLLKRLSQPLPKVGEFDPVALKQIEDEEIKKKNFKLALNNIGTKLGISLEDLEKDHKGIGIMFSQKKPSPTYERPRTITPEDVEEEIKYREKIKKIVDDFFANTVPIRFGEVCTLNEEHTSQTFRLVMNNKCGSSGVGDATLFSFMVEQGVKIEHLKQQNDRIVFDLHSNSFGGQFGEFDDSVSGESAAEIINKIPEFANATLSDADIKKISAITKSNHEFDPFKWVRKIYTALFVKEKDPLENLQDITKQEPSKNREETISRLVKKSGGGSGAVNVCENTSDVNINVMTQKTMSDGKSLPLFSGSQKVASAAKTPEGGKKIGWSKYLPIGVLVFLALSTLSFMPSSARDVVTDKISSVFSGGINTMGEILGKILWKSATNIKLMGSLLGVLGVIAYQKKITPVSIFSKVFDGACWLATAFGNPIVKFLGAAAGSLFTKTTSTPTSPPTPI